MATINLEQQKRLVRALMECLDADGLAYRPRGDLTMEKEVEMLLINSLNDTQELGAVPKLFERMAVALKREMSMLGLEVGGGPEPGEAVN